MTRLALPLLLLWLLRTTAALAAEPVSARRGAWEVTLRADGARLSYAGALISKGSYFTVFRPGYTGTVLSLGEAFKAGEARVSDDGMTVGLSASLPGGSLAYEVALQEGQVRLSLRVTPAREAELGPVEYSVAQLPVELLTEAAIETQNAAGQVVTHKTLPGPTGNSGGLAEAAPVLRFITDKHLISFEAADYGALQPFDGRPERYGAKSGIWAFSGASLTPGEQTELTYVLRVGVPPPPRQPGRILIGSAAATGIVLPARPAKREALAAQELASYLETMTGCRLPVQEATATAAPAGALIVGRAALSAGLVTEAELQKVAPDGYVVRVRGGRAAVCGFRDLGTVYGAYALLRHLGCRFYGPGCELVPATADLRVADCFLAEEPRYESRNLAGNLKLGQTPPDDLMSPAEIGEEGNIVHSSAYLLPYDKYYKEHPEYFALQKDGKRLSREGQGEGFNVHLCLSNPDVRRISAERMLALIEKQSDRTFFGVSQGDGFAWCQCDSCKALDAVPGVEMTDRLLDYVNYIAREVAKRYPDKRLLTLAYTDATSPPPTRVQPEPNVMVQYCPYPHRTDCSSHDLSCEKNRQGYLDLKGWLARCPRNMYVFDYPTGYQNWYEPFGSFWAMKSKLDLYAAGGVRGLYYCGTPQNFRHLFIYVQSALLWKPDTPVEPLIGEFMQAWYGAAAPQVRQYFDYMSREVQQRPIHQMCEGPSPHTVTPEYADTALALLTEAENAVRDDRVRLYRVEAEKLCVLFGDLNARNPANGKLAVSDGVFAQRLADFCRIGRTQRVTSFVRRVSTGDWLYRIARIRPARSPWYLDPMIARLIADPGATLAAEQVRYAQTAVAGGLRLELDGFTGPVGPEVYEQDCPPRKAIWIYGTGSANPLMRSRFRLERVSDRPARLVLTGQDDDKPGPVRLRVTVNGTTVFEGPNTCAERGWSSQEITVPAGVLKVGENELRIATVDKSTAADQGWFMLAECVLLAEGL